MIRELLSRVRQLLRRPESCRIEIAGGRHGPVDPYHEGKLLITIPPTDEAVKALYKDAQAGHYGGGWTVRIRDTNTVFQIGDDEAWDRLSEHFDFDPEQKEEVE